MTVSPEKYVALRSIPHGGGLLTPGKEVPDDVPRGYILAWLEKAWIKPVVQDRKPATGVKKSRPIEGDDLETRGE